jgi:homoserine kinase
MTNINQLSSMDTLSGGDLLAVWAQNNGDTRKAPMSLVASYVTGTIELPVDINRSQYSAPSATGFTVVVSSPNTWLVLNPTNNFAAGTIVLPTGVPDLSMVSIVTTQAITALTVSTSGAAIVAGVMAAKGLLEGVAEFSSPELLALATDMEGHPDNIAPALFGGLTIAWMTDEGPRHKKLSVHRGVSLVVAVPNDSTMSTKLARSLQPETVPHSDAIFNLSRSALLIAALIQSPELLFEATEDRLHQDYRASAMKDTNKLLRSLRSKGFAAVVSGAGPSVLVLCSDPSQRLSVSDIVSAHSGGTWTPHMLTVDERGATVEVLPALAD